MREDYCACATRSAVKVMSDLEHYPICCIDCNLGVDPYALGIPGELIERLLRWQCVHDAIYRLWLDSGEYTLWARDELHEISSPLNRLGLELREELAVDGPVYYWWFQDSSVDGFRPIKHCPICERELQPYVADRIAQYVCEACRIITAA